MGSSNLQFQHFWLIISLVPIVSLLFSLPTGTATLISKRTCPSKCGNITVPYPFGIGPRCSLDKTFELACNYSSNLSPLSFVDGFQIQNITHNYVHVYDVAVARCYNHSGGSSLGTVDYDLSTQFSSAHQFSYSHVQNKFVALGCDVFAYLTNNGSSNYTSGCASLCRINHMNLTIDSSTCTGVGCCQTSIPKDLTKFDLQIDSMNTADQSWIKKYPCSISFVADKDFHGFRRFNISKYINHYIYMVPVVLEWKMGNSSCKEAKERGTLVCGKNSKCSDSTGGVGYQCRCMSGYHGNPYLPTGCPDINECKDPNKYSCQKGAVCVNMLGSYMCSCPPGYHSKQLGSECRRWRYTVAEIALLGIGSAAGAIIMFCTSVWLFHKFGEKKKTIIKWKNFKRNGGSLMEQQISSNKERVMKTKLFTIAELVKATDNFNQSRVLGRGGQGTVYKGMLLDGTIVAVKKSNMVQEHQIDQFINEVLILSQIIHRNIVKLLGCCLESEVPLLVYGYVSNGTLSQHLHDEGLPTIPWESRLRIAQEVAGALAYLHSYASTAIYHRDIKSSNILLDENYRAVLSDFGLSRSIPISKTHLTTRVGGTIGYLDPDYFQSGQFTDKSDVYSFGVVLVELLTGRSAVSSDYSEGLVSNFKAAMKHNYMFEVVDLLVVNAVEKEDILAVAKLAKRCLKLKAKKRPGMIEVAADFTKLIQEQSFSRRS